MDDGAANPLTPALSPQGTRGTGQRQQHKPAGVPCLIPSPLRGEGQGEGQRPRASLYLFRLVFQKNGQIAGV
jgi:hypothetical protein